MDIHHNDSKGDQTPTTWGATMANCRYLWYSVAVNSRWDVAVTKGQEFEAHQHGASLLQPDNQEQASQGRLQVRGPGSNVSP